MNDASPEIKEVQDVGTAEYRIEKQANNNYLLSFKNYSILPIYFWSYKMNYAPYKEGFSLGNVWFELDAETFFKMARWPNVYHSDTIFSEDRGGGCRTGLYDASINPLERFETEISYEDLVLGGAKGLCFYALDSLVDPIFQIPFEKDSNGLFVNLSPNAKISLTDSVKLTFFLRVTDPFNYETYRVESNEISIPYIDLCNAALVEARIKQRYHLNF